MNRRGFLGTLLAGAAAIVGAGLAAPKAEASEAWITGSGAPVNLYPLRVHSGAAVERAVIYGNDRATLHLRAGTFTVDEVTVWMQQSGATVVVGAGADQTTIVQPPTFEAMQADCAARGCRLEWWGQENGGPAFPTHYPQAVDASRIIVSGYHGPMFDADIDAWRRSLHEDAIARRWQAIDEARAESRQALGLPLSRDGG